MVKHVFSLMIKDKMGSSLEIPMTIMLSLDVFHMNKGVLIPSSQGVVFMSNGKILSLMTVGVVML